MVNFVLKQTTGKLFVAACNMQRPLFKNYLWRFVDLTFGEGQCWESKSCSKHSLHLRHSCFGNVT